MTSKVLLRIASVVMLLHDAGHMVGATTWKQSEDPKMQDVIRQMTENKFPFMGAVRTMGEYYDGYGFLSALAMLLIAAVLWIASNANQQSAPAVKQILIAIAVVLLLWGIVELIFFFPFAASFSLLASLVTAIAVLKQVQLTNRPLGSNKNH